MRNLIALLFLLSCYPAMCQLPDNKDISAAREFTGILALQSQEDAINFFQQKKSKNAINNNNLHNFVMRRHFFY